MVKFKVNKRFQDIHTKDVYEVGQVIDIPLKRSKEIVGNLDASYINRVDEKVDTAKEK